MRTIGEIIPVLLCSKQEQLHNSYIYQESHQLSQNISSSFKLNHFSICGQYYRVYFTWSLVYFYLTGKIFSYITVHCYFIKVSNFNKIVFQSVRRGLFVLHKHCNSKCYLFVLLHMDMELQPSELRAISVRGLSLTPSSRISLQQDIRCHPYFSLQEWT